MNLRRVGSWARRGGAAVARASACVGARGRTSEMKDFLSLLGGAHSCIQSSERDAGERPTRDEFRESIILVRV